MPTISDKLDYLVDTKEQIRQAIISKGIPVSDSDTFRSYAAKILLIEGGEPIPISARFWRVRRISSPASNFVGVMGILFDDQFPVTGSPVFSSQYSTSGDFSAAEAFKDNSNMWVTANGEVAGAYIGWDFINPVSFQSITVRSANTAARAEYVPVEFSVEISVDGSNWTPLKEFSTDPWLQNQYRTFSLSESEDAPVQGDGLLEMAQGGISVQADAMGEGRP